MFEPSQPIVKPYLTTRSLQPENQETPIEFINNDSMENQLFYRRNHFSYPTLSYSNYWLPINGVVSYSITAVHARHSSIPIKNG